MGNTQTPPELIKLEHYMALSAQTVALLMEIKQKTQNDIQRTMYEYREQMGVLDRFLITEAFDMIDLHEQTRLQTLYQEAEYEIYELSKKT